MLKEYFPRLSNYLMSHLMDSPKNVKHQKFQKNSEYLLFVLSNFIMAETNLKDIYAYANEKLVNTDVLNKSYLSFVDGRLYDSDYSSNYVIGEIQYSVMYLEILLSNLQSSLKNKGIDIIKHLNLCTKKVVDDTDINSDLYLNEYLEQSFLNILLNTLDDIFELSN